MARILFTVTPAAGHLHPTIPIALALQARGHDVRYFTGLSKVAMLERQGLPATVILRGRADTPEQITHPVGADRDTYNPLQIHREIRDFVNSSSRLPFAALPGPPRSLQQPHWRLLKRPGVSAQEAVTGYSRHRSAGLALRCASAMATSASRRSERSGAIWLGTPTFGQTIHSWQPPTAT